MIILNESIWADLIVFLALFADLATVAVAYDHASYELRPVSRVATPKKMGHFCCSWCLACGSNLGDPQYHVPSQWRHYPELGLDPRDLVLEGCTH